MLRWIQLKRLNHNPRTWLVTLDTSLPPVLPDYGDASPGPLALSLDGLLLWISAHAFIGADASMAAVFSEALKYQLLPQVRFFDIRDFEVFADLHYQCREFPAEDVEGCIAYLKGRAIGLDPSRPEGREAIAAEIARFFADPGRKFKEEVARLEGEAAQHEQEAEAKQEELEKARGEITRLQEVAAEQEASRDRRMLERSALLRLLLVLLIFGVAEGMAVYYALMYGQGENPFQRLERSWPFLAFAMAFTIALGWLTLGRERLQALPWAIPRLLRAE